MLCSEKVTYNQVSVYELERFLSEQGIEYDIVCGESWESNSDHTFLVRGKPTTWERQWFNDALAGKFETIILAAVLECLCEDGKLEPGNYLVAYDE